MDDRRNLIKSGLLAGASVLLTLPAVALEAGKEKKGTEEKEEDVSPAEDLMREHGLLNRVLLVYEECLRRLAAPKPDFDPGALVSSADVIKRFIEEYHEELEEKFLFPRFEKSRMHVELVAVLRTQHQAGRKVTAEILALGKAPIRDQETRRRASDLVSRFIRMYRPHEAREDTVLFPALHEVVSRHEYAALGEEFEKKEHEKFGKEGFEGMVDKVAAIEKTLGLYDLASFTPRG
ncbi:MAG TPA: hemerythrin domain-containing protein [Thermoanaerobaculia bacterium]|nr:hemerythrin domain-containing protein [Thermoanaerobaculia bacterium]